MKSIKVRKTPEQSLRGLYLWYLSYGGLVFSKWLSLITMSAIGYNKISSHLEGIIVLKNGSIESVIHHLGITLSNVWWLWILGIFLFKLFPYSIIYRGENSIDIIDKFSSDIRKGSFFIFKKTFILWANFGFVLYLALFIDSDGISLPQNTSFWLYIFFFLVVSIAKKLENSIVLSKGSIVFEEIILGKTIKNIELVSKSNVKEFSNRETTCPLDKEIFLFKLKYLYKSIEFVKIKDYSKKECL